MANRHEITPSTKLTQATTNGGQPTLPASAAEVERQLAQSENNGHSDRVAPVDHNHSPNVSSAILSDGEQPRIWKADGRKIYSIGNTHFSREDVEKNPLLKQLFGL